MEMKYGKVMIAVALCCSFFVGQPSAYSMSSDEMVRGLTITRGLPTMKTRGPDGVVSLPVGQKEETLSKASSPKTTAEIALQLQFALDSATLLPQAVAELHNLAVALENKKLRDYRFQIEGHTCDLGSVAHNMELSKRRAYAVADWLTNHTSLSPQQFEVLWFGESCPAVPNTDEYARRKNRRVVIRNTGDVVSTDKEHRNRPAMLEIIRYGEKGAEVIGEGDHISSGDRYALRFSITGKSYAYVCQIDAGGKMDLLFPNKKFSATTNPIKPGTRYSLPGNNKAFLLDSTTGREQIFILALNSPLKDPKSACKEIVQNKKVPPQLVATRGIGGVISAGPENNKKVNTTSSTGDNGEIINLCETTYGGKTRGLGGITNPTASTYEMSVKKDNSCEGIVLKRYFVHTP